MQRRRVVVVLPGDAYHRLERLAEREDRATDQQASFLLRRALELAIDDTDAPEAVGNAIAAC